MSVEETLAQLGLDQKEITIYLAALSLGESLILPLAKQAKVKRTALYDALPKLAHLGLITFGSRGKRRTIIPQDPSRLLSIQEERLSHIRTVLPQLMGQFNALASKPKVLAYEGIDGIKQVYEDTLIEEFPLLTFLQAKDIDPALGEWLLKSYVPRRVKRGIRVKNLVSGTPEDTDWILHDKGTYRENRYVSEKLFPANIEVLIYSNKIAFNTFKTGGQPVGIIIENGDIAETMRSFHKMAWEFSGK